MHLKKLFMKFAQTVTVPQQQSTLTETVVPVFKLILVAHCVTCVNLVGN